VETKAIDLTTLATEALKAHEVTAAQCTSQSAQGTSTIKSSTPDLDAHPADREDVKLTTIASPANELPPIRQHSPKSGLFNSTGAGLAILPSISDQLGDLNRLAEAAVASVSAFSQSPTGRPPPRPSVVPGQGSPPKSPNDTVRRELPSPGRHAVLYDYNASSHRRASQSDSPQYASAWDYSSRNTETPSTDQSASTPATAVDRMSIDGITNPQISGFQCPFPGCTAQPFQTQVSSGFFAAFFASLYKG